jgi:ribokinase
MPRMLVVGSTNTDMVIQAPTLPQPGETVLNGTFRLTPGGKGANQAVAAARAGAAVTFVTAVGDDCFGVESRAGFAAEGIDTRYLVTRPGVPSGVALILVDAQGENMIAVASGANMTLTSADLPTDFSDVTLCLLQLEVPLATVQAAAERARAAGARVLLNPAPMPPTGLPDALLRCVDVLTPNAGELRALVPEAETLDDAAALILARGVDALVVTRGRAGATLFTADGNMHIPAHPVPAVDTVGAGDCFSAALGVALLEGRSLPDAARFAAVAAALSTTRPGAQASMPTRAEIDGA